MSTNAKITRALDTLRKAEEAVDQAKMDLLHAIMEHPQGHDYLVINKRNLFRDLGYAEGRKRAPKRKMVQ